MPSLQPKQSGVCAVMCQATAENALLIDVLLPLRMSTVKRLQMPQNCPPKHCLGSCVIDRSP